MTAQKATLQQHPTAGQPACIPVPPDLSLPLINEPAQACPPEQGVDTVGALQFLVGTWTNQPLANGQGGPANPYSYNLMVLPQQDPSSPQGYILKNMQYYEEITFSAIHGNAANRGGIGVQVCNPLFYEQRIYISQKSDTPVGDTLVHAENGAWLILVSSDQFPGPYGGPPENPVPGSTPPTGYPTLVKQIAVPHGNSVLALGQAPPFPLQPVAGSPTIPDLTGTIIPQGVDGTPYNTESVGNPNVHFTLNPTAPLAQALSVAPVDQYIMFQVDTDYLDGSGQVTNIGFEQQHADVVRYTATYWLEQLAGSDGFSQLQYVQTIYLRIPLGNEDVVFPHVTCNTLTLVQSPPLPPPGPAPSEAAQIQLDGQG
ncbi:MAG: hypothetical protein QOE79_1325 [Sphingomonadales bacterium]|jgi:hypothetical protein|nr:hypothetical protein [Sphingomonadales bacterium]